MITQTESGLGAPAYAAIQTQIGTAVYQLQLEQYSLALASHDSAGAILAYDNFDAIVCDDTIVRVWVPAADTIRVQTLASEDAGDQAWSASADLAATGVDANMQLTLATDGVSTVRVFYYDAAAGQVEYFQNAAKGVGNAASWGASTLAFAIADVEHLAAVSLTRVHYTTLAALSNRLFGVLAFSGGAWSPTNSTLYWPTPIGSFDAIAGNQEDDGAAGANDILVFSTDFPPIIGHKVQNTKLVYTMDEVQGLAVVRYQNNRWSDHYPLDVVDEAASYPARYGVRLSANEGLLYLSYVRKDSSYTYSHTAIALSRSKDGIHWELPYLIPDDVEENTILLTRGVHTYTVNSWKTYRSPKVGYSGTSTVTQDVSNRAIQVAAAMGDVQSLEVVLANPQQVLDATTPFSSDATLQARLKVGYNISGTNQLVQTCLADVDSIGGDERLPADHEALTGRDALARLLEVRSDQCNEVESQVLGGDDFESSDDTAYSGLMHTASWEGHWKAEDNELYIVPNESPCMAANTYCTDAQNGEAQAMFQVADTESDDYGGLFFRAYDKSNCLCVKYNAEDDAIKLYSRQDNVDTVLTSTGAMGWTYGTWYGLKVRFRYGQVLVYSSTDGITWTQQISVNVPGVADNTAWTWTNYSLRTIPPMSGRMGYMAHGYSDENDSWYDPPPIIPAEPDPPPPMMPEHVVACVVSGAYPWFAGGSFVYLSTDDVPSSSPSWNECNDGLPTGSSWRLATVMRLYRWKNGEWSVFAGTHCGIVEAKLPMPSEWEVRQQNEDLIHITGQAGTVVYADIVSSPDHDGWFWALVHIDSGGAYPSATWYVVHTRDGFHSLEWARDINGHTSIPIGGTRSCAGLAVAPHSDGKYMAVMVHTNYFFPSCNYYPAFSSDYGETWTRWTGDTYNEGKIYIPYHSAEWEDSIVYCGGDTSTPPEIRKSTDRGANYANLGALAANRCVDIVCPTYDANTVEVTCWDECYQCTGGAWAQYGDWAGTAPAGGTVHCSVILERGDDYRPTQWLACGTEGMGNPKVVLLTPGGSSDKTGNLASLYPAHTVLSIARRDYDAL